MTFGRLKMKQISEPIPPDPIPEEDEEEKRRYQALNQE